MKRYGKYMVFAVTILAILLMISPCLRKNTKERLHGMSPTETVVCFMNAWVNMDTAAGNSVLTPDRRKGEFRGNPSVPIRITKMEIIREEENKTVLDVAFYVSHKEGLTEELYGWTFILEREDAESDWLISNYGDG